MNKLRLSKETITQLSDSLKDVVGGGSTYWGSDWCDKERTQCGCPGFSKKMACPE